MDCNEGMLSQGTRSVSGYSHRFLYFPDYILILLLIRPLPEWRLRTICKSIFRNVKIPSQRSAMLNIMLTSLWFLWGLLLYAVIAGHASWPVYLTGIAAVICAITILPERKRKNVMFGKKKQADIPETAPVAAPLQKTREEREEEERKTAELSAQANEISQLLSARGEEKQRPLASLESRQPTVISKETRMTGDIEISGNLQIWGKIKGQIKARSGSVSIMQSGVVEGDIFAETLLIDGVLTGTCTTEQVEILEHGELNGVCRASNFSIRKGGTFIGQSEPYAPAGKTAATPQTPPSRPENNKPAAVTERKASEKADAAADKSPESAPESAPESPSQNGNGKNKEPQKVPSVFKRV